jgi:hypothetical protein
MVYGLDSFTEFFKGYENRYVFIGGTACELVLEERGEDFRATKDLDIVLLAEALDSSFVDRFIEFVKLADYKHVRKSDGKDEYYRFENPAAGGKYPQMIELFSRRPDYLASLETHLAPIHVDGALQSLSAILLDDDYYSLLENGVVIIDKTPVLSISYLPVFKMKAWLDLTERKAKGEHVNSGDLSKHRNDVFRLTATFSPGSVIQVPSKIQGDIAQFLGSVEVSNNDLRNLKIEGYSADEFLDFIATAYGVVIG